MHRCAPIDRVQTWSNKPCEVFLFSVLSHWWNTNPCYSFSLTHSRILALSLSSLTCHLYAWFLLLAAVAFYASEPPNYLKFRSFLLLCRQCPLQASEIHNSIARRRKKQPCLPNLMYTSNILSLLSRIVNRWPSSTHLSHRIRLMMSSHFFSLGAHRRARHPFARSSHWFSRPSKSNEFSTSLTASSCSNIHDHEQSVAIGDRRFISSLRE